MTTKVAWDDDEGGETIIEVDAVHAEASHWFCHRCHAHFGVPVYVVGDASEIFHCPSCGSVQIEQNEPPRPRGLVR